MYIKLVYIDTEHAFVFVIQVRLIKKIKKWFAKLRLCSYVLLEKRQYEKIVKSKKFAKFANTNIFRLAFKIFSRNRF